MVRELGARLTGTAAAVKDQVGELAQPAVGGGGGNDLTYSHMGM
jgi:hypothetical protein